LKRREPRSEGTALAILSTFSTVFINIYLLFIDLYLRNNCQKIWLIL
jgi:hypothetical protein